MRFTVVLFVVTLLSTCSDARLNFFNPIQLFGLRDGGADKCLSWRLTVEAHNRQGNNDLVPGSCVSYVKEYMEDGQYKADCEEMADVAIAYAKSVTPAGDGKDVWVFDIDETTLSNLGYYRQSDVQYGIVDNDKLSLVQKLDRLKPVKSLKPGDSNKFYDWVKQGKASAVPGIQRLYNETLSLGFKNVILTGLWDNYAAIREKNLKDVGYTKWDKLIFKNADGPTDEFKSNKRTELVKEGYRIVGNVGDQWGDITGASAGDRTFKVPNPMYYH